MAIRKQEFYEGAALHQLVRHGGLTGIHYDAPFFVLNQHLHVLLKYCTRKRSPWGFTFGGDEQQLLKSKSADSDLVIALVCGGDGVAAIDYDSYLRVAAERSSAIHLSCYRRHGEHYEVNGPDGQLDGKVPPSRWRRIISTRGHNP